MSGGRRRRGWPMSAVGILVGGTAVVAAFLAVILDHVDEFRTFTVSRVDAEAARVAATSASYAAEMLSEADGALLALADALAADPRTAEGRALVQRAVAAGDRIPGLRGFAAGDAAGNPVPGLPHIDDGLRARIPATATREPTITAVRGPDGHASIALVRRTAGEPGRIVAAFVDPASFERFFRFVTLPEIRGIALVGPDGTTVARHAADPAGRDDDDSVPMGSTATAAVAGLPLTAVVEVDPSLVADIWRGHTTGRASTGGAILVAIAAMIAALVTQMRRQRRLDVHLRSAIDASMDAFYILRCRRDPQGRVVDFIYEDINANAEAALGVPRGEVVGNRLRTLLPIWQVRRIFDHYVAVVDGREPIEEEISLTAHDGAITWLRHQIVPIDDGVAVTARDVTQRKAAEAKLIEAEARLAEVTASIPGAVFQFRQSPRDGQRFTFMSESLRTLYSLSPEEALANAGLLFRPVLPQDLPALIESLKSSADAMTPWSCEFRVRSGGTVKWIQVDALPVGHEGGITWNGVLSDVTRRKQVETELQIAKDEAETANRTKSRFLANMSHEFRTPLNAIIGFSEGLDHGIFGPLTPKQREYVHDIHGAGRHLLQVINDVLDLAKIEAGKSDLFEEPVDVASVVEAAVTLVRRHAEEKRLALTVFVQGDLPALRADEVKLKQIVLNLLSNAVKFTPAAGRVEVHADHRPGDGMTIRVVDTGIGIAAADIEKVLMPFGQIGSALSRAEGGTGLGLPLVQRLAELHGGRLELVSTPGRGTTASVFLPEHRIGRAVA